MTGKVLSRLNPKSVMALMITAVAFISLWALTLGPAGISLADALAVIWGGILSLLGRLLAFMPGVGVWFSVKGSLILDAFPASYKAIIYNVRLPRVVLGGLVGMSLAVTGGCFQGLFKNPMADPYIIGVSSGASLGAALAIVFGWTLIISGGNWAVILSAFIGALLTVFVVYSISRVDGRIPVYALLLAGVAVAAFLTAMVSLLILFGSDAMHGIVFWIMGSLAGTGWPQVVMMLPFTILGTITIIIHSRSLNAILLGEEAAQHLGVEVERVKIVLFGASSLVVAAAVSVSGVIGFVGLIIPHVVRLLVGSDHRILLPWAAVTGGLFLIICDALARVVLGPAEVPVGIITAFTGAPFFVYLLRKRKREFF